MKERPILFSGAMVSAILAGEKTQTRRVVKPQPHADEQMCGGFALNVLRRNFTKYMVGGSISVTAPHVHECCPYGQTGDRLWVRETSLPDFPKEFSYYEWTWAEVPDEYRKPEFCIYKASWMGAELVWKPSIFMPRWASRITLEITGVRVGRLQDISEADARAEGAPPSHPTIDAVSRSFGYEDFPRSWYAQLWDSINAKTAPWASNPWVWVIEFKRAA